MRVGMIQSNYIPWRGYFDFIDDCDVFIFYDDVQYTHKDWRNRNRIKTNDGVIWLTVPVLHERSTLIETARIRYDTRWVEKHIRSLTHAYGKAPHFRDISDEFFAILQSKLETISWLNVAICRWVMAHLNIRTQIRLSSEFKAEGSKFERPLQILRSIGATDYLSGPAARPYTDEAAFRAANIGLSYKAYRYPEYPQIHGPYVPDLSILDLMFNCGETSRQYLKSRDPSVRVV